MKKEMEKIRPVLVTVKCLVYNHEAYIRQCLEGFVMQKTNFRFEVIVHDDASTDGSAGIICEYAEKYPDIIKPILETENQYSKHDGSIARILNEHTHGKYIAICEGDDYWIDSLKLQKQVDFLEKHSEYVLSHTSIKYYYQSQHFFISSKDIEINSKIQEKGYILREDILSSYRIQTASVVYRRNLLEKIQESDPFLYKSGYFLMGDTPLWYGLLQKGKIHFLQEVTTVYRKNNGSVTGHKNLKKYYRFILSMAELRLYLALRDNLSKSFILIAQKRYQNSAVDYLAFDPSFNLLYPLELEKVKSAKKKLYKMSLLKYYLSLYISIRSFLGYLRRYLIKSI